MQILGTIIVFVVFTQVFLARQPTADSKSSDFNVLQVQVMPDRAGFSPGVIHRLMAANTKKALAIFQKHGRQEQAVEPVTRCRITAGDAAGPFVTILSDMMQKGGLRGGDKQGSDLRSKNDDTLAYKRATKELLLLRQTGVMACCIVKPGPLDDGSGIDPWPRKLK